MNNLNKKRKTILNLSLASIIIFPISIILLIISPLFLIGMNDTLFIGTVVLNIIGILSIIPAGILGLIAAILTLCFPKTNTELDDKRIIFGILGIVLLGPLMPLIFACIAKKYVDQFEARQVNVEDNSLL